MYNQSPVQLNLQHPDTGRMKLLQGLNSLQGGVTVTCDPNGTTTVLASSKGNVSNSASILVDSSSRAPELILAGIVTAGKPVHGGPRKTPPVGKERNAENHDHKSIDWETSNTDTSSRSLITVSIETNLSSLPIEFIEPQSDIQHQPDRSASLSSSATRLTVLSLGTIEPLKI